MLQKSDLNERELLVHKHVSDILRFGAAIGWWHDSQNPLHRKMASNAMDAASVIAAKDLVYRINEFDCEKEENKSQTRRVKIKEGLIYQGSGEMGGTVSKDYARNIAHANNYPYPEDFCKAYDGQELLLDEEGKIIK